MKFTLRSKIDGQIVDTYDIDTDSLVDVDFAREQAVSNIACSVYARHYGKHAQDANEALDAVGDVEILTNHCSPDCSAAGGDAWCAGENFEWNIDA